MRKLFVKNILFVLAINILVKPIWTLFIDMTVQNKVPGGQYGTYQALLSLSIIFQIVLDFGITSYNSRTISRDPGKLPELFPSMLSARLVLIGIYMFLACGWAMVFGYRGPELMILLGILIFQALNSLLSFIRSNIAALQRFKTDGILSITDRLLAILICSVLLLYPATANNFRIEWFVATQIASYSITCIAAYLVLRSLSDVRFHFVIHAPTIMGIIKQSLPYALLIFQMSIYNRADALMVERICANGKMQADIFASAFRLIDMANMFGLMFATMLLPLFGRMLAEKQSVQPIVKLCGNLMLPLSFVVAVAGVLFSNDIMHMLYKGAKTGNAHEYQVVFSWLIASFPGWCLMYIYSTLLTANGNLRVLNFIAFCGVIFNLLINFLLIPRFEAVGAAMTSFFTQTLLAITFAIACARILKLDTNIKWILSLLGYLCFAVALGWGIVHFVPVHWLLQVSIFFGLATPFLFVFRFVTVDGVRQLAGRK